jgi:hypothetical protein
MSLSNTYRTVLVLYIKSDIEKRKSQKVFNLKKNSNGRCHRKKGDAIFTVQCHFFIFEL